MMLPTIYISDLGWFNQQPENKAASAKINKAIRLL